MQGLSRLRDNDFVLTESKICSEALEKYKITHNPVPNFIKHCVESVDYDIENKKYESAPTQKSLFKQTFDRWARDNGIETSIGAQKFWELFEADLKKRNRAEIDVSERRGITHIRNYKLKKFEQTTET